MNEVFSKADSQINNKQPITLLNLQEHGIEWSNVIIAISTILSGLIGLLLGNHLSSKSQVKKSKLQSLIDEKNKWINDLRNDVAEFVGSWSNYELTNIQRISRNNPEPRLISESNKFFTLLISSKFKVDCLLDSVKENHINLKNKTDELITLMSTAKLENKDMDYVGSQAGDIIKEITKITNELITEEKGNLRGIEKEID